MSALPTTILPRVSQLIRMLDSESDGEALSAVRALRRALQVEGLCLHDLAELITGPAAPAPIISKPIDRPPRWDTMPPSLRLAWLDAVIATKLLSPWQSKFAQEMRAQTYMRPDRWRTPSQRALEQDTGHGLGRGGAAMTDILKEHAKARRLRQSDIDRFVAMGVPPLALAKSCAGDWAFVGRERVAFDGMGRFEFERETGAGCAGFGREKVRNDCDSTSRFTHGPDGALNVYTVVAFDQFGDPADIFAWRPGQHGLWLGAVDVLGAEQLLMPRIAEPALDVHATVLDWLRADRRGIVVLNPARAASDLRMAEPLRVATIEHGRQLRHALTIPPPRIVVKGVSRQLDEKVSEGRAA